MDYIYSGNKCAIKSNASAFFNHLVDGNLFYICYHITTNSKYPFVQIMLEKSPFNVKQIYKEEFLFPSVSIHPDLDNQKITEIIINQVNINLNKINCDPVLESAYMGVITKNKNVFALINVSSSNINHLKLSKNSTIWFALPTEIINIGSIYNIPISSYVISLFTYEPELGVLYNPLLNNIFLLPDVAFTYSDSKRSEFQLVFGPSKKQIYYHFYKYSDFRENLLNNRYALFIEDPLLINPLLINPLLINPLLIDPLLIDPLLIDPLLIDPLLIDPIINDNDIYSQYENATCIINNITILIKEYELFHCLTIFIS